MKHLVIYALLLGAIIPGVHIGCLDKGSRQHTQPDSLSLQPVPDNPPNINVQEYLSRQYSYPEVWLKPIVDDVRLRASPMVTEDFIIYMEGEKKWTGKVTDHRDTIPLRGTKRPFPWLEMVTGYAHGSPFSWVYEGCVRPSQFDFKPDNAPDTVVANRWVRLEPVAADVFKAGLNRKGQPVMVQWLDREKPNNAVDSMPVRLVVNGKSKIYRDHISEGESYLDHTYLGERDGWHIIHVSGWEHGNLLFVRKSDALEFKTQGAGQYIPLPSPAHKHWAFPSGQTYGFGEGFEVFDPKACRSFSVNIGSVKNLLWEKEGVLLFELLQNNEPRYYRFSFQDIFE